MMRIYYLIILFSINLVGQNETLNSSATYIASMYEGTEDGAKNPEVINQFYKSIIDKHAYFKLIFNKTESYYFFQKKMIDEKNFNQKIANTLFGDDTSSYVNRHTNESVHLVEAYGEFFLIPIKVWDWKLTNERKKIGDYICFKASTSYTLKNIKGKFVKDVVAWYSPEINYPYGPKGFNGLPGLIIELYDSNIKYAISNLSFNSTSKKIRKPTNGKKITQEEFDEIGIRMEDQSFGKQ